MLFHHLNIFKLLEIFILMEWKIQGPQKIIDSFILGSNGFSVSFSNYPSKEKINSIDSGEVLIMSPLLMKNYSLDIENPEKEKGITRIEASLFSPDLEDPYFYLNYLRVKGNQINGPIIELRQHPSLHCLSDLINQNKKVPHYLHSLDYGEENYARYSNCGDFLREVKPFLLELCDQDADFYSAVFIPELEKKLSLGK